MHDHFAYFYIGVCYSLIAFVFFVETFIIFKGGIQNTLHNFARYLHRAADRPSQTGWVLAWNIMFGASFVAACGVDHAITPIPMIELAICATTVLAYYAQWLPSLPSRIKEAWN